MVTDEIFSINYLPVVILDDRSRVVFVAISLFMSRM